MRKWICLVVCLALLIPAAGTVQAQEPSDVFGAVSELKCSVHFGNDTPAESVLWVELTYEYGPVKAVFVQNFETEPIHAAEDPDRNSYIVHVIRNQCTVIVYEKDESGELGRVVNVFVCSPGRNNWTITGRYGAYDREVWLGLLGGVAGHYATLIWGDFLFHSVPYRGGTNSKLKAEEYNKLGEPASSGCIRMAVSDAKWIFDNCVYGTTVHLFDSEELPVVKPVSIQINLESQFRLGSHGSPSCQSHQSDLHSPGEPCDEPSPAERGSAGASVRKKSRGSPGFLLFISVSGTAPRSCGRSVRTHCP